MKALTYAQSVFRDIGFSNEAARELEVLCDVVTFAGLGADDLADQIQRAICKEANARHIREHVVPECHPDQLHLWDTPLRN